MRIITTAGTEYLPGLYLTIASVMAFWTRPDPPRFLVITTHLPDRILNKLRAMVSRQVPGSEVDVHIIDKDDLAALPPAPGLHRLTYGRLLAPRLATEPRFLYLDSDLLVLRDVEEIFSRDLGGCIAAAPLAGRLGDDCPWWERDGLSPDAPYFCAGVMVVDRERWMKARVSERCLELLHGELASCKCLDQTVLNYLLYGKVDVIPSGWSRLLWDLPDKLNEETFILHYITNGKPWRAPSDAGAHGLWIEAFRLLCGRDFPLLAASLSARAKGRLIEHVVANGVVASLSVLGRVRGMSSASTKALGHWKWRQSATADPAQRPEAGHCRQLLELLKKADLGL